MGASAQKQTSEPMPLNAGTRLGPYEVTAMIGEGGMSAGGPAEPGGEASPSARGGSHESLRGAERPSNRDGGGVPGAAKEGGPPPPVQKVQTPLKRKVAIKERSVGSRARALQRRIDA